MEFAFKNVIWRQFGAAIDMLDNAVNACPDELWRAPLWELPAKYAGFSQYWYLVYHSLFWLDLYLSGAVEGFQPPAAFTLDELDPDGLPPQDPYSKEELQAYLQQCRQKCQATIAALTDEAAQRICRFRWGELSYVELLLYNMRHVQEHAAQLNMLLGQNETSAPGWVIKARE